MAQQNRERIYLLESPTGETVSVPESRLGEWLGMYVTPSTTDER